jgi:asparagine synthase (glutamine-hydrolysing)
LCGICGWFDVGGREVASEETLRAMIATLRHRGPDETGIHYEPQAGLAIARLSVMDPGSGQQPYRNESGNVIAVFNGEIYNFVELREQLQSRGHQFRGLADGEVIVHLYEEFGADFPLHLNGMFAIALLDRDRGRLLLVRDRLGIKPLYVAQRGTTVWFASEAKALLTDRRLNPEALSQYLRFEYVPAPRSIWAGIDKLPPASLWDNGRVHRYWKQPVGSHTMDPQEAVDELDGRLRESVRRQMVSDVPLGVFLSGGLDSSTLVGIASTLASVQTFSVGFAEASFDESRFARQVAEHCGTTHHHRQLTPAEVPDLLARMLQVLDEPLADAAVLPTLWLSQLARTRVTVALSGEGADEVFGGYPTYQAFQLAEALERLPAPVLAALGAGVRRLPVSHRYLSLDFKLKRFFAHLGQPPEERHQSWMGSFARPAAILRADWPCAARVLPSGDGLQDRLDQDLALYLVDDLLVKLDRATMAVSLEGRVPYLDHTLVEWVSRLPIAWKVGPRSGKWLLKQVAKRYLPRTILDRPKKGFGIPLGQWFAGPLRELLGDSLQTLKATGIFQNAELDRLFELHQAQRADFRKELWTLVMLAGWFETWQPSF